MGIIAGPSIVDDASLIFHYDMGNTVRSFKGKPTTNLFGSASTLESITQWDTTGLASEGFQDVFAAEEKKVREDGGSSGHFFLRNSSLTGGVTYTQSIYVKPAEREFIQIAPSTGFPIGLYANFTLTGEGSISGTGASKATIKHIKNGRYEGWYRCAYTETANATTLGRMGYALIDEAAATRLPSYPGTEGYGVYILHPQIEASSFATPYDIGTRNNTQAIVDIAGGKTITIDSLTYPDSNTFEFTSANEDFMTFPYTQSDPNNFTLEAWIYHTAHSSNTNIGHTILQAYSNTDGWIFGLKGTDSRLNLRQHNVSAQTFADITYGTGLSLNTWYHVVAACNNTTDALYVNGEQVASQSHFTGTTGIGNTRIGAWGSGASTSFTNFAGKIPVVRVYNGALSEAEIKQNYESQKGRFL